MTVKSLQRMYDYNYWANKRLLTAVSHLTTEQFIRLVAGGHGSVRNTLVHVLSAEWGWLDRCGGHGRGPALKPEDYPDLDSVVTTWAKVERWMRDFLSALTDADVDRIVEYSNAHGETRSMILGELLQHAANHGAHHRGQVALLLRVLGQAPGNFDLLFYDADRRGVNAW